MARAAPHPAEASRRPDSTGRLRRLVRDAAIVLAMTIALLAGAELVLRLFFPQHLVGTPVRGQAFSVEDSVLGLRYVPGAVWRFSHPEYRVEYAVNAHGFRDATTHPATKPAGTVRVLLLGDSFTFGQGVEYVETWPVRVERELARRGLAHVELVKAGMQGADTRSELVLLRRLLPQYRPDVVVVGFLINDLYTNTPEQRTVSRAPRTAADSASADWNAVRSAVFARAGRKESSHLLALARRWLTSFDPVYIGLYLSAPGRGDFLQRPLPERAARQLEVTRTLLRTIAATCDSAGASLVVVSIPQQFQVLYERAGMRRPDVDVRYYDRALGATAESLGVAWVPTLDVFAAARGNAELFYRLDGHLTPRGNAVLAGAFIDRVVPLIAEAPAEPQSEDRVDERRQRRALREDQERADDNHGDDHRKQPPLLPDPQEQPQLTHQRRSGHRPVSH